MDVLNLIQRIEIVSFLTGISFIVIASIILRFPPKKINYVYGYRTSSSMKNQETWNFSQRFSAVKMLQVGLFLLAASLLNILFDIRIEYSVFIGFGLMLIGIAYMIAATEIALQKNFPNKK